MSVKAKWEKEYNKDIWNVRILGLGISVVRQHLANPGFWTMHCPVLRMETVDLKLPSDQSDDLAKGMAVNLVRDKLKELSAALGQLEGETK